MDRPEVRANVVLLVFARPDTTARLVEAVRAARPARVLVVADGPRPGQPEEAARCEAVRAIVERVPWECEVLTNYAEENLGLDRRVVSGLDWAFELADRAIVLEDDCLPHPSFFPFCEEVLARYGDDPRVMSISGSNFQFGAGREGTSYYFSRYPQVWGWATWARAWKRYDAKLSGWPEFRRGRLASLLDGDPRALQYWTHALQRAHEGRHAWDYGWLFAHWLDDALSVVPARNLVTNVGFREDATNTRPEHGMFLADVPAEPIELPLRHPPTVEPDLAADAFTDELMFGGNVDRLFRRIRVRRAERGAA